MFFVSHVAIAAGRAFWATALGYSIFLLFVYIFIYLFFALEDKPIGNGHFCAYNLTSKRCVLKEKKHRLLGFLAFSALV